MTDTIVPQIVDVHVDRLLKKLGLVGPAVRVPLLREPGAVVADCFGNVDRKMATSGGEKVHGWAIWLFPGVWVEGEFHALWRSSTGDLIDVTPKAEGEAEILFVIDPKRVYDGRSPKNVHQIISEKPIVADYSTLVGLRTDFIESRRRDGSQELELVDDDALLYEDVAAAERSLLTIVRGGASRNHECPCGSGKKFKVCHEDWLHRVMVRLRAATKANGPSGKRSQ